MLICLDGVVHGDVDHGGIDDPGWSRAVRSVHETDRQFVPVGDDVGARRSGSYQSDRDHQRTYWDDLSFSSIAHVPSDDSLNAAAGRTGQRRFSMSPADHRANGHAITPRTFA